VAQPYLTEIEERARGRLGPAAAAAVLTLREYPTEEPTDGVGPELRALAADPEYLAVAHQVIELAAARARAVQDGEVPFVPDKAFVYEEAGVVERAARCGLQTDAPWVATILRLFADVSVAPTAAKALPSQAVANAIARAIRDVPTPEAVAQLDRLSKIVRHATVKRRYTRLVPVARKALAGRPGVGLRVLQDEPMTKPQVKAWLATLEGAWIAGAPWPAAEWSRAMHGRPELSAVTTALVWQLGDGRSFWGAPGSFTGSDGAPVTVPRDARVQLWHPLEASDDERLAWRHHVLRNRVEQPFAQVYREFYRDGDLDVAGLELDLKQLVGIARREGWTVGEGAATRRAGDVMVDLLVDATLYPGVDGSAACGGLVVGRPERYKPEWSTRPRWRVGAPTPSDDPALESARAVVVSEVLRSADLLVSASAASLRAGQDGAGLEDLPWWTTPGGALRTRRDVLGPILAELPPDGGPVPVIGKRHVEVGPYRIHLTTAQVTRDGAAAELAPARTHDLWAPSQDRLLAKIVGLTVAAWRAAA
jgi:hypothetical protein